LRILALALVAACSRSAPRPKLVEVTASWCAACRVLERDALADPDVVAELARFDVVIVDASDDPGKARAWNADVLPTLIPIDSAGREQPRLIGTRSAATLASELRAVR